MAERREVIRSIRSERPSSDPRRRLVESAIARGLREHTGPSVLLLGCQVVNFSWIVARHHSVVWRAGWIAVTVLTAASLVRQWRLRVHARNDLAHLDEIVA